LREQADCAKLTAMPPPIVKLLPVRRPTPRVPMWEIYDPQLVWEYQAAVQRGQVAVRVAAKKAAR